MSVTAIMAVREPSGVAPATRGAVDGFADVLATVSDAPRPGAERAGSERADARATTDRTPARQGPDRGVQERPAAGPADNAVAAGDAGSAGDPDAAEGCEPVEQPTPGAPTTGDLGGLVAEHGAAAAEPGPVVDQPRAPHSNEPVAPAPADEAAPAVAPAVAASVAATTVPAATAPTPAPAAPAAAVRAEAVAPVADDMQSTGPAAGAQTTASQPGVATVPVGPAPVAAAVVPAQPATTPVPSDVPVVPAATTASPSTDAAVSTAPETPAPVAPAHAASHVPVSGPSPTAPPAPTPSAAPLPTAPPMVDQLGAHLRALAGARAGTHVLSVALDPKNLGEVRIVAHISSGQVRIDLAGANDAARAALRGTLDELRRDLQSAGLEAELGLADERSERGTKDGPRATTAQQATTEQDAGDRTTATPIDPASGHSLDLVV